MHKCCSLGSNVINQRHQYGDRFLLVQFYKFKFSTEPFWREEMFDQGSYLPVSISEHGVEGEQMVKLDGCSRSREIKVSIDRLSVFSQWMAGRRKEQKSNI